MHISIFLVVLFLGYCQGYILERNGDPSCDTGVLEGDFCCHINCRLCGECFENSSEINNVLNQLCCKDNILASRKSCDNYPPPCLMNFDSESNDDNDGDDNDNDDFYLNVWELGIIIMVLLICYACTSYICCCFGYKKPPLKYDDIKGKIF